MTIQLPIDFFPGFRWGGKAGAEHRAQSLFVPPKNFLAVKGIEGENNDIPR